LPAISQDSANAKEVGMSTPTALIEIIITIPISIQLRWLKSLNCIFLVKNNKIIDKIESPLTAITPMYE
jgi:hypothetical protein